MVITILKDKYKCGSNMGMNKIEYPDLLKMLNSVIEWEFCEFPKDLKDGGNPENDEDWIEDRNFLGSTPKLEPGNIFVYDSQVIAVDSDDKLILCLTETGVMALKRFYEDILTVEYNWKNNSKASNVKIETITDGDATSYTETYKVPFGIMRYWKKKVQANRWPDKNTVLKVSFDHEDYVYPVSIVIQNWSVKYKSDEILEDRVKDTANDILAWCWNNLDRVK